MLSVSIIQVYARRRGESSDLLPNETLNRQTRAFKLTELCLQWRLKTKQVEWMSDKQWNMLGEAAKVNLPISQQTRDLVVDLLKLARTPVVASKLEIL